MALLHATPLFGGTITTTATYTNMFTVPAGERVIIRSLVLRNLANANQVIRVQVNGVASVFTVTLTAPALAGSSVEWRPWLVLGPGQTISLEAGNAAGVGVMLSGSIYTI